MEGAEMKTAEDQLNQLRNDIDSLDEELVAILAKRMEVVQKVADLKKKNSMPAWQNNRWEQMQENRVLWAKKNQLDPEDVCKLFETIHKMSVTFQEKIINPS